MRDMLLWTLRGESIVTISFVLYATKIYLGSVYFQQRLSRCRHISIVKRCTTC